MAQNWQDPGFAEQWDARHLTGNPARAEHLALLREMLIDVPPGDVLDLGCGSGLVALMILQTLPQARLFGIDWSPPMLDLARERLHGLGSRFHLAEGDLRRLAEVIAPSACSAAVAVQSFHHLTQAEYRAAAGWTFEHLAPGAWFVIIDRLAIPSERLYTPFRRTRARQGQAPNPERWSDYLDWLEANGDRPLAVQQILPILEEAGFMAACLDVRADRGMLVARRPG